MIPFLLLAAYTDPLPTPEPTVVAAGVVAGEREPRPDRAQVSRIVAAASIVPARWQAFAACVERRESGGNSRAVNRSSGAAGLYQFMPAWRRGLPYVVGRGLVRAGMTPGAARAVRLSLPHRIEAWPARFQRVAFAQIIHEGGRTAALRHWHGGRGCDGLAAS